MLFEEQFQHTPEEQGKIVKLREFVLNSADLDIGTDDALLTKFLNFTDWHVDRAFSSIRRYYEFKASHPDWLIRHPLAYYKQMFYHTKCRFVMPKPDRCGRAIIVLKTVDAFDLYANYHYDLIQLDDMFFESLLLLPQVQKAGIVILHDLNGMTKNFMRLLSPSNARVLNEKNEVLPFKTRIVHVVQQGFLMNTATNMVMPFMSKDFREKFFTHDCKNLNKLRDMVGYESLPAVLGGPSENVLDVDFSYGILERNADYLLKLRDYRLRK